MGCGRDWHRGLLILDKTAHETSLQQLAREFRPLHRGAVFSSPQDTDIEHIVARSEAHDSGLCRVDLGKWWFR